MADARVCPLKVCRFQMGPQKYQLIMAYWQLRTPVAFLIFNRPHTTERVFAEIAKAKPPKLFIVADGPRRGRKGEAEKCAAARAIIEQVNWDCEVLKNYAEENLGMGRREYSGFDWVFDNVEEAILLEDDCLPHPTFFRFCEELLEKYRFDTRVMGISGNNFQFGRRRTKYSYYFSHYVHCWGWATWKRAWQAYDFEMRLWPEFEQGEWLKDILIDARAIKYWEKIFHMVLRGEIDTWDYQWMFACWIQHGLTILPNVNLVENIGFAPDGTYCKEPGNCLANICKTAMTFPLRHPPFMIRDFLADQFEQRTIINQPIILQVRDKIKKMMVNVHEFGVREVSYNYLFKYLFNKLIKLLERYYA